MTKIGDGKGLVRETQVLDGGRPIVVELLATELKLSVKGKPRVSFKVGYATILDLARKMKAHLPG